MMGRPLHVVQVGSDDTIFQESAPSDTLERQLGYAAELDRQRPGSTLTLLTFSHGGHNVPFVDGNMNVIPLPMQRAADFMNLLPSLSNLHRGRSIDVITTQTPFVEAWLTLAWARPRGIGVVAQVHFDLFSPVARRVELGRGLKGRLLYRTALRMMPRFTAVRVVGRRIRQNMVRMRLNKNVHLLPVPVNVPQCSCHYPEPPDHAPTVLYVGRLVPQKNLFLWLQVAARVAAANKNVVFRVVGEGPLGQQLEMQAARLGLGDRVSFTGAVRHDELAREYSAATALLLTSSYEGFGRVALEAALCGIPVVSPKITGVEDIVVDGTTGFLTKPGDSAVMAGYLLNLLTDPDLCRSIGNRARQIAKERYDAEHLRCQWMQLLINQCQ